MTNKLAPQGYFQKSLSEDKTALIATVQAKELVQDIARRVGAYPPAMKHIGEAVLGAVLMHALGDTSEAEKLELQWRNSGPFGHLFVDVLNSGNLRATIQNPRPEVYDFKQDLGAGLMQVRKVKDKMVSSTGIVQSSGKVAQDIVDFLKDSEQKPCLMNLFVDIEWDQEAQDRGDEMPFHVKRAEGFVIHVLPPQGSAKRAEEAIQLWNQRMKVAGPLSEWAVPDETDKALPFMLHLLTVGSKPQSYGIEPVAFECTCSKERAEKAMALLSQRERDHIAQPDDATEAKKESIEITCEYCGARYDVKLA